MQTDSEVEMETQSERGRRYMASEMCEVSDPEEWMVSTTVRAAPAVPSLNREVESIYEFVLIASTLDEM